MYVIGSYESLWYGIPLGKMVVNPNVLLVSLDYLNPVELIRYIMTLIGFVICMLAALQTPHIIYLYLHWELLGIFSYLLVNFYSARLNCGVKAVVFNKIGRLGVN